MKEEITPDKIINPPSETYKMKASCSNCDYIWTIEIQRGIPAHLKERRTECPHCGCSDSIYLKSSDKW